MLFAYYLFFLSNNVLAAPKYTSSERFGIGFDTHQSKSLTNRTIDNIDWKQLGIGWYLDWGKNGKYKEGLSYMGLVGGWSKGSPASTTDPQCNQIKNNQSDYKSGMMWTVGNEIGWDDTRSPEDYANDFINWRSCLKSINPTFKVGSGAIISLQNNLNTENRQTTGQACVSKDNTNSGKSFFTSYINKIKESSPDSLPDFIVYHGYTYCYGAKITKDELASSIKDMRQVMKD